jgi:hypothetical protein
MSFCIQFFRQRINIVFQHTLPFTIEMKIAFANDACSKPPITIKSHNLHDVHIRGAMGEIVLYHDRD